MTNREIIFAVLALIVILTLSYMWAYHMEDERTCIMGINSQTLVKKSDLNRTDKNRYSTYDDVNELQFGDTVMLETIENIVSNYDSTKTHNVYYEDAYDMKDIADGVHLKPNQINHLEKAVVCFCDK